MAEPIFNLVRVEDIEASEGLDYASGADLATTYDEVLLVDDAGEPCAEPIAPTIDDLDERYDFADGAVGEAKVARRHVLRLNVDGLTGAQYARLKAWHQDRAEVRFTPGFGRHSELAWRPVEGGSSYSDLTGRYTLNESGDATHNYVWDDITIGGAMRDWSAAGQRIIATPGGAGQVFEDGYANLLYGQTWSVGLGSTTTVSTVTGGFGHTDFADSTRVVRTADDAAGMVEINFSGETLGSAAAAGVAFPIRGRVPPGSTLQICHSIGGAAIVGTQSLDDEYADWTMVYVEAAATFATNICARIYTAASTGTDTSGSFEIGPAMGYQKVSAYEYIQPRINYVNKATASSDSLIATSASVTWPKSGSLQVAFFVPDWFDPTNESQLMSLFGGSGTGENSLFMLAFNSIPRLRAAYYLSSSDYLSTYLDGGELMPGEINTITITWDSTTATMYLNGASVDADTAHVQAQTDRVYRIGASNQSVGSWPMIQTGVRLERDVWSADRVAWEHAALYNAGAQAAVLASRGRTYQIRALPSSPVVSSGQSSWRGVLELEQVSYDADTADITTKER